MIMIWVLQVSSELNVLPYIYIYMYIYICIYMLSNTDRFTFQSIHSIYRLQWLLIYLFRNSICFLSDLLAAQSHLEINVSAKWIPLRWSWKNTPNTPKHLPTVTILGSKTAVSVNFLIHLTHLTHWTLWIASGSSRNSEAPGISDLSTKTSCPGKASPFFGMWDCRWDCRGAKWCQIWCQMVPNTRISWSKRIFSD